LQRGPIQDLTRGEAPEDVAKTDASIRFLQDIEQAGHRPAPEDLRLDLL
jgi:hypothetical protein